MLNPFGPQQDPSLNSYVNLQKRVLENVKATRINDQIFEIVQKAYEDALKMENVRLAQFEKKIMLAQITKEVLTDMIRRINDSYKA
jgi:hypothetical protein